MHVNIIMFSYFFILPCVSICIQYSVEGCLNEDSEYNVFAILFCQLLCLMITCADVHFLLFVILDNAEIVTDSLC